MVGRYNKWEREKDCRKGGEDVGDNVDVGDVGGDVVELVVVAGVVEPSSIKESVEIGSSTRMEWEVLERDHRAYASLFQALKAFAVTDCIADAVSASRTDMYPDESIANTLDPRERFLWGYCYWSSKGQSDPDVPESLIYGLNASFCIITEINIKPFWPIFSQAFQYAQQSVYDFEWVILNPLLMSRVILCNFKRNNGLTTSLYGHTLHRSSQWLSSVRKMESGAGSTTSRWVHTV
ncbi:hypothetical protein RJ639_001575 [Escallonia herrerae]|uniref:Uncharacterized protein n=1 Tax=Escallonia herrerae TaxID=1293975 RepID=A0AA88X7G6_9ASTE|nr:hypothetical protein RJ639_001575 [Escallonia herrerae]